MQRREISVVVPIHNEIENFPKFFEKLKSFLKKNYKNWEIIIVEDGSTDGTREFVQKLRGKNIIVFTNRKKQGKGKAVRKGLRRAKYSVVGFIDGDGSVPPEEIKKVARFVGKYDVVIGSRYLKRSKSKRNLWRWLMSKIYNFLVGLLFGTDISDHQCGIKFFNRKGRDVMLKTKAKDMFFDTEFLVRARNRKLKIKEIPITWKEKEKKSKVHLSTSLSFLLRLILLKLGFLS